jgi:hypothetical protein
MHITVWRWSVCLLEIYGKYILIVFSWTFHTASGSWVISLFPHTYIPAKQDCTHLPFDSLPTVIFHYLWKMWFHPQHSNDDNCISLVKLPQHVIMDWMAQPTKTISHSSGGWKSKIKKWVAFKMKFYLTCFSFVIFLILLKVY